MTLRGNCLCGDITFRIEGAIQHTATCHCVQCRKVSGHFWSSLTTSQDDLILESGEASLTWYPQKNAERGFCVICGSQLFWRMVKPDDGTVDVALGAIDGPVGERVRSHLYADEKGDYYDIPEDAVVFPGARVS